MRNPNYESPGTLKRSTEEQGREGIPRERVQDRAPCVGRNWQLTPELAPDPENNPSGTQIEKVCAPLKATKKKYLPEKTMGSSALRGSLGQPVTPKDLDIQPVPSTSARKSRIFCHCLIMYATTQQPCVHENSASRTTQDNLKPAGV